MERVGGDHRGRDSRTRQSARQNQTRIAGRHYRYQEQHNRLCDRAGRISRSSRAHVRETPALRYLSWGVRGDHGVLVIATMTDANRPKRDSSNRIRMRQSELGSTAQVRWKLRLGRWDLLYKLDQTIGCMYSVVNPLRDSSATEGRMRGELIRVEPLFSF